MPYTVVLAGGSPFGHGALHRFPSLRKDDDVAKRRVLEDRSLEYEVEHTLRQRLLDLDEFHAGVSAWLTDRWTESSVIENRELLKELMQIRTPQDG